MISNVILLNHGCTVTQLLVSVRNRSEAELAMGVGVDVLDIKEPNFGSLGIADHVVWEEIADVVDQQTPLSVACGELREFDSKRLSKIPSRCTFAKVGLSGLGGNPNWIDSWIEWRKSLGGRVQPVAVAYADETNANAPSVDEVAKATIDSGAQTLLIDTYQKDGSTLFDYLTTRHVSRLVEMTHQRNTKLVIGGSIKSHHIPMLIDMQVDIVAVRGAVCTDSRESQIDPRKIEALKNKIVSHKHSVDVFVDGEHQKTL